MLRDNGSLSDDITLIFDEMYLEKSEQFTGSELVGSNEEGNLYRGIMCFMIAGLKNTSCDKSSSRDSNTEGLVEG